MAFSESNPKFWDHGSGNGTIQYHSISFNADVATGFVCSAVECCSPTRSDQTQVSGTKRPMLVDKSSEGGGFLTCHIEISLRTECEAK